LSIQFHQKRGRLFFQVMNRRYERASTVLTSNKGFEESGDVLGDDVMAAALIDRVLHHCHLVNIRGNSYRMRQHMDLYQARSVLTVSSAVGSRAYSLPSAKSTIGSARSTAPR
jgi:hypothetical protein